MSYKSVEKSVIHYWWKKQGKKTVEEILKADQELKHNPHSVQKLNDILKATGWDGKPIEDKYTPEEKNIRQARYERLHENNVRRAATIKVEQEKAKEIQIEQRKKKGLPTEGVALSNGDRYPENLMYDFSGTKEAREKNAEISEVFLSAKEIGDRLKREAKEKGTTQIREKTPEEKEVERKFNEYHQQMVDRIKSYPMDDILKNAANDDTLVDHIQQIEDIAYFHLQYTNIEDTYAKAEIEMPEKLKADMAAMRGKVQKFEVLEQRNSAMDIPYYKELDVDDANTVNAMRHLMHKDAFLTYPDVENKAMGGNAEGLDAARDIDAYNLWYKNLTLIATKELMLGMGVLPENMMVQCGNKPAKPFLEDYTAGTIASEPMNKYDDLTAGTIDHMVVFDKTDPTRKIELADSLIKDYRMFDARDAAKENPLPQPVPKPPKKPGIFARIAHAIVPSYKKEEFDRYNEANDRYTAYQAQLKQRLDEMGVSEKTPSQRKKERKSRLAAKKETAKKVNSAKTVENKPVKDKSVENNLANAEVEQAHTDGYKRFEVKQTKKDIKFDKVDLNYSERPDLTDGVRSWQRSANQSLGRSEGNGRAGAIGYMGKSVFDKVSKNLDKVISSDKIEAHDPKMNEGKKLPSIHDKLGEMKLSDVDVHAMGMYQMFCDENGKMREDGAFSLIQKDPAGGLESLNNFSNYVKANYTDSAQEMTYAALVEKMRNKEPIIPEETQKKLLDGYAKKLDSVQKVNEKSVKKPQNKLGQKNEIEKPVIKKPVKQPEMKK